MPEVGEVYSPFRAFKGSIIPNEILKCQQLSSTAKLVFGRLCQYAGEDGKAYPSYNTLGHEVGIERRQTIRAVKELEQFGLIRVLERRKDDGGFSSNTYIFLWHAIFTQTEMPDPGAVNDTKSNVTNGALPRCQTRHRVVSLLTPKENQTRDQSIENTTTGQIRSLLSGTPFFEISVSELQELIKPHGYERVALVADFAAEKWRRDRKEIHHPFGYLRTLCISLVPPPWYEPYDKRQAKVREVEERKRVSMELAREESTAAERENQAMNSNWSSLTGSDREKFLSEAADSLVPELSYPEVAITALAKSMAWESRAQMNTNGYFQPP